MKQGKIIVISGPSGSGKTTLYQELLRLKNLKSTISRTVSYTTRPKRPGEINGRDYFFISPRMFKYKKKAGHFLESEQVFSHSYATAKKQVKDCLAKGKNVILAIDVKGAATIRKKVPDAVTIFIKPPSGKALKKRLLERGSENKQTAALRLKRVSMEMGHMKHYDYVVVNDNLREAVKQLAGIINSIVTEK